MALIPWVTKGPNRTVVEDPRDFNLDGKAILVLYLDLKQLETKENTNVSYDLHVGENYLTYRDGRMRSLDEKNNCIRLPPKESAIIYTAEQVHFPASIFGLIVPRQTLLKDGLSNIPTKVDPGYGVGPLVITVFNHSNKPFELRYHQPFCALCLLQVDVEGARPRAKGTVGIPITPGKPRWPRMREWLVTNQIIWLIIAATAGFGSLVWLIIKAIIDWKTTTPSP